MANPVLLIGLGGIGSQVVNKVYEMIPPEERKKEQVAVCAIDTNVNDLDGLGQLNDRTIQISGREPVWGVIKENEEVKSWFPYEFDIVNNKMMTDGAGQIRAVSRLAFYDAMRKKKFAKLEHIVTRLFLASEEQHSRSLKVMVVSSLAGGTGSGMFIQLGLYLRHLFEAEKIRQESTLIRGAFLLPDVLVHNRVVRYGEVEHVRANGYACIKELNAIISSLSKKQEKHQIELEYRPPEAGEAGVHANQIGKLPYDFIFLYDYENSRGEHLDNFRHYIDQMSSSVYLQMLSPIASRHFSLEDNTILKLVEEKGLSRYGGSSVHTLEYPEEGIRKYLALALAREKLDLSWLRIDKLYREDDQPVGHC